jgi:hypothetical protein
MYLWIDPINDQFFPIEYWFFKNIHHVGMFSTILVNMWIIYSWKFFLSCLVVDYAIVSEIDYFFNNSLLFSNWGNSM